MTLTVGNNPVSASERIPVATSKQMTSNDADLGQSSRLRARKKMKMPASVTTAPMTPTPASHGKV